MARKYKDNKLLLSFHSHNLWEADKYELDKICQKKFFTIQNHKDKVCHTDLDNRQVKYLSGLAHLWVVSILRNNVSS